MQKDMEVIRVYISKELKEKINAIADIEDRSLSSEVVVAIKEHIKQYKKELSNI